MTIAIADDTERIGHAILEIDRDRNDGLSVSLQFPDKTYLGLDGDRSRKRHLFETEPCDVGACRRFRLGPEVTAHVLEAEIVTFADVAGESLGSTVWEGVRAPPEAGSGARVGEPGRKAPKRTPAKRTVVGDPPEGPPEPPKDPPPEPKVGPPPPPPLPPLPAPPLPDQRRRAPLPLVLGGLAVLIMAAVLVAVLAGLIGWDLKPTEVRFTGPAGGPFQPVAEDVRFVRAWWVRPAAFLFGSAPPLEESPRPPWLDLRAQPEGANWDFRLSANAEATRGMAPSTTSAELPLVFPLRRDVRPGLVATLTITPPGAPPPRRAPPPQRPPQAQPQPRPQPQPARSTVDDVVCDQLAGNRYDPDHPADRGYKDEIFDLTPEDAAAGLAACDPSPHRSGPDRRFAIQRGRLLAERALRKLKAGDVDGAIRDMDEAVAIWKRGDELGSAYAANLLGAYYKGTFNRPAHKFVEPDERVATEFWDKAMRGGSMVAQRNYAAQLMMGRGIERDPARALTLLQEALDRGDLRSAGVLGVAYYTGSPPGVPLDKERGWAFIVQAQCVDRDAGQLLTREIASRARPASARHSCP